MSRRKENGEGEKMEVKRHSNLRVKFIILDFYQGLIKQLKPLLKPL